MPTHVYIYIYFYDSVYICVIDRIWYNYYILNKNLFIYVNKYANIYATIYTHKYMYISSSKLKLYFAISSL